MGQIPGETSINDASHWNGPLTGSKFMGQGLINKSSQGKSLQDDMFEHNAGQCFLIDTPTGAYHFLNGDNYKDEARNFYNSVCAVADPKYFKLGFWADIEKRLNKSIWQYETYASAFLLECQQLFGTWIGIYTSPGFWDSYIAHNSWACNYFLWNAQWPYHPKYNQVPHSSAFPWIPYDWTHYHAENKLIVWQYEGDMNFKAQAYGFPGRPWTESLDYGRFMFNGRMGTPEEYVGFFHLDEAIPPIEPPDPPDPPIVEIPDRVRIVSGGNLRLRNNPSTISTSTMGWCRDGTIWYPELAELDESGRLWYGINQGHLWFAAWLTEPVI